MKHDGTAEKETNSKRLYYLRFETLYSLRIRY